MDQDQQVEEVLQEVPPPEQLDAKALPETTLHSHADPRSLALTVLCAIAVASGKNRAGSRRQDSAPCCQG